MRQMLIDRIELARRELKKASGTPLTAEEAEKQRREEQVAVLEDFAYRLGMDCHLAVFTEAVWSNGPAIQMVVPSSVKNKTPDTKFYLRPNADEEFALFQEVPGIETSELLIAKLHKKDPQFANRMLVLVGDAIEKIIKGGSGPSEPTGPETDR